MQKLLFVILLLCIMISFTACEHVIKGRTEIDDITFVRVVGVDKVADTNKIRITIVSKRMVSGDGKSQDNQSNTLSADGDTIFEAARKLHTYSDKTPYWGHVEFILIGEEAAKDDIVKFLDFFSREHQFRFTSRVVIVKGESAKKIIDKTNSKEMFLVDRLDMLFKNSGGISLSSEVKLNKLMESLDSEYASAYAPCIHLDKVMNEGEQESDMNDIILDSYSMFRGAKLLGFITGNKALGLNWVIRKVESGVIVVKDEKGSNISLGIVEDTTKIIPKFEPSGKLSITIKIIMSSNIGEYQGRMDIFNEKTYRLLEKQQEEIITSQVMSIVKYAQENKIDIFSFGNTVYHEYPIRWKSVRDNWLQVFSKLPIHVEVISNINRTYIMNQPTRKEGGKR